MKQVTELYVKIKFKPVDQGLFLKIRYRVSENGSFSLSI